MPAQRAPAESRRVQDNLRCTRLPRRRALVLLLLGLCVCTTPSNGNAQVVLDGKFGTSGPMTGPIYQVTPDVGLTRGNNLFHSFAQFDLKTGDSAVFSGPPNIQNILGRVTGGTPSTIDGTLRSEISGANLFLINPNGVVFGPNALVDVSGAFAASGAHYLRLADDARFVASLDANDSLLSTAPVAAFGFLDRSGGRVEVQGHLQVGPHTSLSLVGTSVSVTDGARLEAPNGQIQLQGARLGGEVDFPSPSPAAPASGVGVHHDTANGSIVIRGGRLVVDNAIISATASEGGIDLSLSEGIDVIRGGQILTRSTMTTRGGDITLRSPSLRVDGLDEPFPTRIAAETFSTNPQAAGGNIIINSETIELRKGAEISVSSFGAADAGRLEIQTQTLRLEGSDRPQFPTQISANASPAIGAAAGAGGEIFIHAQSVDILHFAGILAATTGDAAAGSIEINADSLHLANGAITTFTAGGGQGGEIRLQARQVTLDGPFASLTALTTGLNTRTPAGNGGTIRIAAGQLQLLNDAGISANTFGDGRGGNIQLVTDTLLLDQATFQPGSIPGITAASRPPFFGTSQGGRGGDISIVTGSLSLRQGMIISTTTATPSDGGNLNILAGTVDLNSGSSIQSASSHLGKAGTIVLASNQDVRLHGQSFLSTSAPQSSGGDIQVQAGTEIQLVNSQMTAQAGPGGGGNITLTAPFLVYLLNSTLTAQAVGDGGNIAMDPVYVVLNHSGLISRSSSANGGNITVQSQYFLQSASSIDASAPFGLPGTVIVSAPEVDLSASLVDLPANLLNVEAQLRPDCAIRLTGGASSFVMLGRGGLPLQPGGFLPGAWFPPFDEKNERP
jgi:filamentous hemagglutinin family protein